MELSVEDVPNIEQSQFNAPAARKETPSGPHSTSAHRFYIQDNVLDILDLSQLIYADDETWLHQARMKTVPDLKKWLYEKDSFNYCFQTSLVKGGDEFKSDSQKNIDTRTFTRPKKRLSRPSIEKYNEELYGSSEMNNKDLDCLSSKLTDSGIHVNGGSQDDSTENSPSQTGNPLHFDLTQPVTSFKSSFDNMLANASLIDSFQNMSPPSLVNSMCSSTFANLMESSFIKNDPALREIRDTDYTESVLLQDSEPALYESIAGSCTSLNSEATEGYIKRISYDTVTKKSFVKIRESFDNNLDEDLLTQTDEEILPQNPTMNGTYQRNKLRPKATFRVADGMRINGTYQKAKVDSPERIKNLSNSLKPEKDIVAPKRLLDRRPSPSFDRIQPEIVIPSDNSDSKRNSYGSNCSTDNLDYMSLSSGSSKSSHKILSMEGINAIADMQEKSLQQVMSTPKVSTAPQFLWKHTGISPITGRNNSDPDLSSSEFESKIKQRNPSLNAIKKQKSLGNLAPRELQKLNSLAKIQDTVRLSHPNLKIQPPSRTNLKSMGVALKGSYTSLKPAHPNLPVAPPLDGTVTVQKSGQAVKNSGLPRPLSAANTGIPRPMSRIPGPRTLRPPSVKSSAQPGRY